MQAVDFFDIQEFWSHSLSGQKVLSFGNQLWSGDREYGLCTAEY